MRGKIEAIVIDERDNVATALSPLKAGSDVFVEIGGEVERRTLLTDIPMGHKFALKDIEQGSAVIKYGQAIGQSVVRITRGEHVHVHNVVSRPRGGEPL